MEVIYLLRFKYVEIDFKFENLLVIFLNLNENKLFNKEIYLF